MFTNKHGQKLFEISKFVALEQKGLKSIFSILRKRQKNN